VTERGPEPSDVRYQGLRQAATTDVWWADSCGRLRSDLPAWRAHTGQAAEDLRGDGWLEAVHPDHRDAVAKTWRAAVRDLGAYEDEFPILSPAGAELAVFVRAQPIGRGDEETEWLGTVSGSDRVAETLRTVGAALVSELDLARVMLFITDAATQLAGADYGVFFYNVAGDGRESFPLSARSGVPWDVFGSYLAAPVCSRSGDLLGALFLAHAAPGALTVQHERLVEGLAAPAAIAIDNARLFQAARRLAERLAQMQAMSARLAGAKDVDEVAEVIVTGAARALGSARASLYGLGPDGRTLRLLHAVGYEGALRERWSTIDLDAHLPATDALRDRRLMIIGGDEGWAPYDTEAEGGIDRSVALAVIPLALGEQRFGVATFGWDEPRAFGEDEARFLAALSDECSQALERARLYELERETARILQRSLLPPRTPQIRGMEVAALHRPGDRSVAVGGDFYDVFRIGGDRWGVSMGDVCGRGASAAARTALVRHTLRAVAGRGDRPLDVLLRLNDAMLAEPEADDRFCATIFGHVDLVRAGASVAVACAGHPRPVVIRRDGWIDFRGQPGTLVGVVKDLQITEDRFTLAPGDALLFCTDGIWEARNPSGEIFADEGLPEVLLGNVDQDAESTAHAVQRAALDFSGGAMGDDLAILVLRPTAGAGDAPADLPPRLGGDVRRPPPPREARTILPPRPASARAARRFLAAVLTAWRMPELLGGDAALLLSELATNAILHAESPFSVIVRYDGRHLRVEVGDGSRERPHVRAAAPDLPGGHGLRMIDTVARRWGVLLTGRGKRVWFELPAPRPAAAAQR